jgi:hypothetical protein
LFKMFIFIGANKEGGGRVISSKPPLKLLCVVIIC